MGNATARWIAHRRHQEPPFDSNVSEISVVKALGDSTWVSAGVFPVKSTAQIKSAMPILQFFTIMSRHSTKQWTARAFTSQNKEAKRRAARHLMFASSLKLENLDEPKWTEPATGTIGYGLNH
jgi:hypothetical protein